MHRKTKLMIVPFCVVFLLWMSAGGASAQTKKLACVGDSITALPSSWCGELGKKMPGWTVQNFGVSGTNGAKTVGQPYWSSAQYKPSHDFLPNLVVIMLGTNDGVPRVWNGGKSHFVADYEELIDTYEKLSSKPRVYAIIPIPAGTGPFGHDPNIIADEIGPAVKMAAMNKNVTTIDGFNAFGGKDFDKSLYGTMDQIHPNAKGQGILADAVYKVLEMTGGLTGMPITPTAGDGGVAGMAAADAGGGVTGSIGGSAGTAADGGAGSASAGGAADGGVATDAGRGIGGKPVADSSTSGARAPDSGATAPDGDEDEEEDEEEDDDDDDETADSDAPPGSATKSRDAGGCQTTGSSSSNHGLIAMLLLLFGLALRSKIVRGMRGR